MKLSRYIIGIIGILLLFFLIWKIGPTSIISSFRNANYSYLLIVVLFLIPMLLIQTAKWQYFLIKQNIYVNFFALLKMQAIGVFYELITPAKIGYFIKIAYLKEKTKKSIAFSSSSVVVDRFLDFLVVASFALVGSLLLIKNFVNIFYISLIIFAAMFLLFFIFINKNLSKKLLRIFYRIFIPERMRGKAKESFNEFYSSIPKKRYLFIVFILTILFWFVVYTQAYLTALAFNVNIPYIYFITIFPISVLIALIPISISGFGTREAALLVLFKQFGVENQKIIAFSVTWALVALIFYSIIALILIFKKEKNEKETIKDKKEKENVVEAKKVKAMNQKKFND